MFVAYVVMLCEMVVVTLVLPVIAFPIERTQRSMGWTM